MTDLLQDLRSLRLIDGCAGVALVMFIVAVIIFAALFVPVGR